MEFRNIAKNKKRKLFLAIVLLISLAFLGWYSFLFEPNNIKIERISVEIENLSKSFDGVKIIHLTDFHSRNFGEREKKILEIIKKLNPDFIFITGDFIDHTTEDIDSCQEFWRELGKQEQGKIFGVFGNHEHYWNKNFSINSLKNLLEESEIIILSNENKKIFRDDGYFYLVGVDDPDTGNDDLGKAMGETEKNIPKILLAHSPDIINNLDSLGKEKIDLILAGHTHGGQIRIPFIRPFWVPTKNRGKYASGLFKVGSVYLYVNRGIGTTILPIRFNCPPEIAVIELRKK
ncbi:MAG: metallophosphoesterase [Minisyncoccales bacterium]